MTTPPAALATSAAARRRRVRRRRQAARRALSRSGDSSTYRGSRRSPCASSLIKAAVVSAPAVVTPRAERVRAASPHRTRPQTGALRSLRGQAGTAFYGPRGIPDLVDPQIIRAAKRELLLLVGTPHDCLSFPKPLGADDRLGDEPHFRVGPAFGGFRDLRCLRGLGPHSSPRWRCGQESGTYPQAGLACSARRVRAGSRSRGWLGPRSRAP